MATYRKRKNGWYAEVRRRGHPPAYRTFDTKADAKVWAEQVEAQMRRGRYVDNRDSERTTLAQALDRYISEVSSTKKGGKVERYRSNTIKRHKIALYSLANITGAIVAQYRDERLKSVEPNTVNNEMILISHLYNVARREWGMRDLDNPVEDVKRPKRPAGRDRRISAAEEQLLLEHAKTQDIEAVIILAIETGMRRGEIAGIRREHVDGNVVHLAETKNGTARDVPLSSRALAAINRLPARLDGRLVGLGPDRMSHLFQEAAIAAGLSNIKLHDCRHEATSRLFERGLDIAEVAAITGHKTWSMLKRYTHLKAEDLVKKLG